MSREKVLFTAVDPQALGVVLGPDAAGCAAEVRSMLTPLPLETCGSTAQGASAASAASQASLEVGDVLFAVNGRLVHRMSHEEALEAVSRALRGADGADMAALSFLDPYAYYRHAKAGTLKSTVMEDDLLLGKVTRAGGWRKFLPAWALVGVSNASSSLKSSSSMTLKKRQRQGTGDGEGKAFLRFSAGDYEQALQVYTNVLERDQLSHTVRVSRSLCYLKLGMPTEALKDADLCCSLKPEWPVSYLCRGAAHEAMDQPSEACYAYLCGLVVDSRNEVIWKRLNSLFDQVKWTFIEVDGARVMESVAFVAIRRDAGATESWGADLFSDRFLLFKDSSVVKSLLEDGTLEQVAAEQVVVNKDFSSKEGCALFEGDRVNTLNLRTIAQDLCELIKEQPAWSSTVTIVGVLSGARLAAAQVVQGEVEEEALKSLSNKRPTLFSVFVDTCGFAPANGIYVPQEERNGSYVFENGNGCLLSLESFEGRDGWIIGRDRNIFYACALSEAGVQKKDFAICDDNKFVALMHKMKWRPRMGAAPAPRIYRSGFLPSLSYLTGETDDDNPSTLSDAAPNEEWTFDMQILALKGFGNRALNMKEYDEAMACFDLVEDQIEALILEPSEASEMNDEFVKSLQANIQKDHLSTTAPPHRTESSSSSDATISSESEGDDDVLKYEDQQARLNSSLEEILNHAKEAYKYDMQQEIEAVYKNIVFKILLSKAQVHLEKGEPEASLKHSRRAAAIAPLHRSLSIFMEAKALTLMDQLKEAEESCSSGLELIHPHSGLAASFRGLRQELATQQNDEKSPGMPSQVHQDQQTEQQLKNSASTSNKKAGILDALPTATVSSDMVRKYNRGISVKVLKSGSKGRKLKFKFLEISDSHMALSSRFKHNFYIGGRKRLLKMEDVKSVVKGIANPAWKTEEDDQFVSLCLRDGTVTSMKLGSQDEAQELINFITALKNVNN